MLVSADVQLSVTEVSGNISKDTMWSGNILVTWPGVTVSEGVTLTVEPGTTVKFKHWRHGYADPDSRIGLGIRGTLKAIGTPEKPIRFSSDAPSPEHGDWWGIGFNTASTHSIIDHCIIEYGHTGLGAYRANFTLSNSIVRWSTCANVFLTYSSANITHNRLYENGHGSIEMEDSSPTITYNTIWTNGIYADCNSHPIISRNIIRNCFGGIVTANFAAATIEYNTITETELGISVIQRSQAAEVTIKYNNIYGNKNVNIQTDSTLTDDVDATNNWWGTTDKTQIESGIMDSRRDPALRTVFYEPYLTSEVDIGTLVYDFENNETYAHLPGTENDTFLYIYPDDDTRKTVDSWHPFDFPTGIAWDGQYLWIVNQPGKTISKFDTSLRSIDSFLSPATSPYGLTFDGKYLWLMEYAKPLVYQLDLTGKVIKSIPAPGEHCMGLAWDGKYLWTIPSDEPSRLYKFDTLGNIAGIVQTGAAGANGIACDGRRLWVVDTGDDMICEIEPSDGRIIRSITTPGDRTFGMAWQGPYLWCTDWTNEQIGSGRVFKIQPMEEKMTIDGLKDDWINFKPLIYDPEGDSIRERTDIRYLYGFTDHKYLYLMVDFHSLSQYHHVSIEMDFDNDTNRDYLLQPSADQTFVSFTDLRGTEAKSWTRINRLFIPYSNIKDVYEVRIPLAFIENRSQSHVRVLMQGEQQTIDETGWAYVPREGETTPPLQSIISCVLSKPEIIIGEAITISGYIDPPLQAPVTIQYSRDNGVTWLNLTTLISASNGSYSYSWMTTDAGSYKVRASWPGDKYYEGAASQVTSLMAKLPPKPAEFRLSNLQINPTEVETGQEVRVTFNVSNIGEVSGKKTVTLVVNSTVKAEKEVTVDGGKTLNITFTISKNETGTYEVTINGLTGEFKVKAPPPTVTPPPTSVIAVGATVIAAIILGAIWLFKRKRV